MHNPRKVHTTQGSSWGVHNPRPPCLFKPFSQHACQKRHACAAQRKRKLPGWCWGAGSSRKQPLPLRVFLGKRKLQKAAVRLVPPKGTLGIGFRA